MNPELRTSINGGYLKNVKLDKITKGVSRQIGLKTKFRSTPILGGQGDEEQISKETEKK